MSGPDKPDDIHEGHLLEIARHEEQNLDISIRSLDADFVDLADEGFELYRWLALRDSTTDSPGRDEYSVSHFIIACGSNLLTAVLSIMRGRGSDSAPFTRRAVEGAAFLLEIRSDPSAFDVWKDAADDEQKATAYRRRFAGWKVLPLESANPLLQGLRTAFEECSELAHPTIRSFAGRLMRTKTSDGADATAYRYFDLTVVPQARLALLWTLGIHGVILCTLTEAYDGPLNLKATDWVERLKRWAAKLAELRRRVDGGDAGGSQS